LQQELEGALSKNYSLMEEGLLKLKGRWYIPCIGELEKIILDEFLKISYSSD